MRRFVALYEALDGTTSTLKKVAALASYLAETPPEDAAWGLYFLSGRRLKRLLSTGQLRAWATELAGIEPWLFEESHGSVGDLAEVIALLLGHGATPSDPLPLSRWIEERILPLRGQPESVQRAAVTGWWATLDERSLYVLNKILTGSLRVGVSSTLVERAVASVAGVTPAVAAHRLMGDWKPTAAFVTGLLGPSQPEAGEARQATPYPFFLASPLEQEPGELGDRAGWQAEWKWDGIRAQLLRRDGQVYLWSRGEELVTERFPEVAEAALRLPSGVVIDGEILAFRDERPLPFAVLQRRIGRQTLGPKVLADAPVVLMAYDLLEQGGEDLRERPLAERRARLEEVIRGAGSPRLRLSEVRTEPSWEALAEARHGAREQGVEGLMLKRLSSPYATGRRRGDWWKWKIDPYTIDAVLVYGQAGHGKRANLFTDYTFALWHDGQLVPIAKAYSGLTDEEIGKLDRWIRAHTRERFGPVRSVDPELVFELAFEGIQSSPRHKSGVAVRFPRIVRWRDDKKPAEADTLATLQAMARAHATA